MKNREEPDTLESVGGVFDLDEKREKTRVRVFYLTNKSKQIIAAVRSCKLCWYGEDRNTTSVFIFCGLSRPKGRQVLVWQEPASVLSGGYIIEVTRPRSLNR